MIKKVNQLNLSNTLKKYLELLRETFIKENLTKIESLAKGN